jgi:phosphoenolpyruvate carboxylase
LAHPPKTINGKFRVTEQGEMITQNFGSIGVAERTLDIYTAAVLAEKFSTHVDPRAEWRAQMDRLSEISCEAYRKVIQVLKLQMYIGGGIFVLSHTLLVTSYFQFALKS